MKETCSICRHSKFVDIPDCPCAEYYCKKKYIIDHITGFIGFAEYTSIRKRDEPHCPYWEQGGNKGFFQRLFRKLNLN